MYEGKGGGEKIVVIARKLLLRQDPVCAARRSNGEKCLGGFPEGRRGSYLKRSPAEYIETAPIWGRKKAGEISKEETPSIR